MARCEWRVQRDLDYPSCGPNLANVRYLFEAAEHVGAISLTEQKEHSPALVSLDATTRSNITVGPPSALATYEKDSPTIGCRCRFDADDKQLISVREAWNDGIQQAFLNLPKFTWETPGNNQTTSQQQAG